MATHATHKTTFDGKLITCQRRTTRKNKQVETALADRALARLMREINSQVEGR